MEEDVKVIRKEFPGCRQWNELSLEELRRVWELKQRFPGATQRMDRAIGVWLYLNDAKIFNIDFDAESGEWVHGICLHPSGNDEADSERAARYDDDDLALHLLGLHIPKELRNAIKTGCTEDGLKKKKLAAITDFIINMPLFGKGKKAREKEERENAHGTVEELPDDVDGCMEWLDENGLTQFAENEMEFCGRRFFLPSPGMVNETWQQYNFASALARNAYVIEQGIKEKLMEAMGASGETLGTVEPTAELFGTAAKELDEEGQKLIEAQARFMAHMLVPAVWKWKDGKNGNAGMGSDVPGWAVEVERVGYSSTTAEHLKDFFVSAAEKDIQGFMFWNAQLMMYLDSCHAAFVQDSELKILFKGGGDKDNRSPIMKETDTVNAIMKWMQAYPTQEDVYNNNAVMILGNLKDMAKEAERIDKMTRKK